MRFFLYCFLLLSSTLTAAKLQMVVLLGEDEYKTHKTLPYFLNQTCLDDFEITYLKADADNRHHFSGIEKIKTADLLLLSVWRLALPKDHLELIKDYVDSAKPLWVMRTSTHGFALRTNQPVPVGSDQWPDFDKDVLGCDYNGHHSSAYLTNVEVEPNFKDKLLKKIKDFSVRSWLYKVRPMADDVNVLLWGSANGSDKEPVSWTRTSTKGGKVFCTTMGHPEDFLSLEFQTILYRSIYWCIDRDVPEKKVPFQLFADPIEQNIDYSSTTFDGRKASEKKYPNNASARTIWLRPGLDYQVAFDPDLLRVAMVWKGEGMTADSMSAGSYSNRTRHKKAPQGEFVLPKPIGEVLLANPLVKGVDSSEIKMNDPRKKLPDPKQLSLGPLPREVGQYKGLYMTKSGPVLSYKIHEVDVLEHYMSSRMSDCDVLERQLNLSKVSKPMFFHLGDFEGDVEFIKAKNIQIKLKSGQYLSIQLSKESKAELFRNHHGLHLKVASGTSHNLSVYYSLTKNAPTLTIKETNSKIELSFPDKLWPYETVVKPTREPDDGSALIKEEVPLPYMNPEHRNVRPADIAFFKDGRAAIVTFDGDVWLMEQKNKRQFSWKRYATGLHEPQGIAIRDEQVFVFDRNGLIRLHDRDNNGEVDYYENFCDLMIQSLETREFSMGLELMPDRTFVIAKGGQRKTSLNPHSGALIRVSEDGRSIQVIANGLREPYFGIDSKNGDIFASDQQGNWVPTTPFLKVEQGDFFGHQAGFIKSENNKFTKPKLYIPHPVTQSGVEVHRVDSKAMGYLNKRILYGGYGKPMLGMLNYSNDKSNGSAYFPLNEKFDTPILKMEKNPIDGVMTLVGFQIWDTRAKRMGGVIRVRPSKKYKTPSSASYYKEGIRLDFTEALQPESLLPIAFKLERWNYLRTHKYGSGYYDLKGEAGKEKVLFSSLTLSKDQKSLFIATPNMQKSMQLGLSYAVMSKKGHAIQGEVYLTISDMKHFYAEKQGFPNIDFNAKGIKVKPQHAQMASVEFGRSVIDRVGCLACHSPTEKSEGRNGPPWKGLFESQRDLRNGVKVTANEAYLKESILTPLAKVSKGYEPTMPPYAGLLSEIELNSIILYLKSIK